MNSAKENAYNFVRLVTMLRTTQHFQEWSCLLLPISLRIQAVYVRMSPVLKIPHPEERHRKSVLDKSYGPTRKGVAGAREQYA